MTEQRANPDRADRDRDGIGTGDDVVGGGGGDPDRDRGRIPPRAEVDVEMGGTPSHRRASFSDPIPPGDPDGVAGPGPVPGREE